LPVILESGFVEFPTSLDSSEYDVVVVVVCNFVVVVSAPVNQFHLLVQNPPPALPEELAPLVPYTALALLEPPDAPAPLEPLGAVVVLLPVTLPFIFPFLSFLRSFLSDSILESGSNHSSPVL